MHAQIRFLWVPFVVAGLWGCGDNHRLDMDGSLPVPAADASGSDAPDTPGTEAVITSPDGAIVVTFRVTDGAPTYEIARQGVPIIAPSPLGLHFESQAPLTGGFAIAGITRNEVDTTWLPVWGDTSEVREQYQELLVTLRETSAEARELAVIFRVFDDGVGLRYQVPEQPAFTGGEIALTDEDTQIRFAQDGTAWWTPADFEGDESLYQRTPLSALTHANTPVTIQLANDIYVAVHEADLDNYAAMTLAALPDVDRGFVSALVPASSATSKTERPVKARLTAPFETPWRTLTITTTAGKLIESHLILNLNDPCAICDGDTSWIQPSKYMGVWWEIHKGLGTWEPGPNVAATTERTKEFIDFAGAHGIPHVFAEGWNLGWQGSWTDMDFTRSHDRFDLAEVTAYAAERGVKFMAHMETGANVEGFEAQMDDAFTLYQSLGISAVKTGYVGSIPGYHHYSQRMVNHYAEVAAKAAEHRIMINVHEPIKPTGEHRTYPNFMTREGLRGMEWNAWSAGNPPSHTLILPFTRMLGGPVDYNPGIFNVLWAPPKVPDSPFAGSPPTRVQSTRARELASYVHLLSGLQMVTDIPEHYQNQPEFAFIARVPATWDETRVIHAAIGEYLTIARRSGDTWYIGSGTDAQARTLEIPLTFLGDGTFVAETFTDDANAHYVTAPHLVAISQFLVTGSDTLVAAMESGGGQAVRIRPATAEDRKTIPAYRRPVLDVSAVSAPGQVYVDDFFAVTTEVANTGNLVGSASVDIAVNGKVVSTKTVRMNAGASGQVIFELRLSELGQVMVSVGDAEPQAVTVVGRGSAPSTPAGLAVTEVHANAIHLAWNPAPGAIGYRVYRHLPGGIYGGVAHAELGAVTSYVDTDVALGQTYFYMVRAVHPKNALSPASNEVSETASAQMVNVTFRVRAPADTPAGATLYIPGDLDILGPWDPGLLAMQSVGGGIFEATLAIAEGTAVQYKYTRGSWERVEWWGQITSVANRSVLVQGQSGAMLVDNTSTDWDNPAIPDGSKGIRYWRDPLVALTDPANGAVVTGRSTISIVFARDIAAAGDYSGSVAVERNGAPVAGQVTEPTPGTLVFTADAPLGPGAYSVLVTEVESVLGGDSVAMQAPYTFSFTIQ